jgi:hypothetical protein
VIGSHHESVPVEGAVIATVAQRRDAGASTARCDHAATPWRGVCFPLIPSARRKAPR